MENVASDAARGRAVPVGEVTLWVDDQGPADADTIVLLPGADSPGFRWTPAIVTPLLDAGFRVVRVDLRDCGRSSPVDPSAPYRLAELAADVVALLDELAVGSAHLVGRSMGGMISQVLALDHPERVRSITLVGSTPGAADERLPGPDDDFVEAMTVRLFEGPPRDDDGRVGWIVDLYRLLAGTRYDFDADKQLALARAEVATGWSPETGHGVAVHSSPSRLDRLDAIHTPTLVVHGTADPVFPIEHGRALANGIEGAVFVEVEGLGHEVPDALIDDLLPVLIGHISASTTRP